MSLEAENDCTGDQNCKHECPDVSAAVAAILETMPHNGASAFSTNKNALGHDQFCYKCRLEAALRAEGQEPAPEYDDTDVEVLKRRIRTLEGYLKDINLLYIKALDRLNGLPSVDDRVTISKEHFNKLCQFALANKYPTAPSLHKEGRGSDPIRVGQTAEDYFDGEVPAALHKEGAGGDEWLAHCISRWLLDVREGHYEPDEQTAMQIIKEVRAASPAGRVEP